MMPSIIRWLWISFCIAVSWWFIHNVSHTSYFTVISIITLGWIMFTFYIKRDLKWSLINYMLTPILLWITALSLLIIVKIGPEQWLVIGIAVLLSLIWSATLKNTLAGSDWRIFRGNLLSYINSFIVFFTASSIYGGITFLSLDLNPLLIVVLVVAFVLHLQIMLASHIKLSQAWLYSLISALVLVEFFGVLTLYPTSFLVNGFIVTVVFYVLTGISRCDLTSVLSRSLVWRYVIWGGGIIFVILITAQWK